MTVSGSERDPSKTCNTDGCNAWATKQSDRKQCRNHGGETPTKDENPDVGAPEANNNNEKHGLHTSARVFFENADQHHLDTYYAVHESLCTQYETIHGELPYAIKKDLSEIAFEMAKLDMAKEYEAENAADPSKPITETQTRSGESGTYEIEVVSKVESLKTDIRRENRLALKDMNIYNSPESQKADNMTDLGEAVRNALQD